MRDGTRSMIVALLMVAVILSTSYVAAGLLHDHFVPKRDRSPVATVTIVAIATDGLGGTHEHLHVPAVWTDGGEYDMGVRVVGLRSEGGVKIKLSISHEGISTSDVELRYYDEATNTWKVLGLVDEGDRLVATLGLAGGIAVYPGYDVLHRLLVRSYFSGPCQVKAWAEWGD